MVSIDLTNEEVEKIIIMIEGSTIPMAFAEQAMELFKKFKDAKE